MKFVRMALRLIAIVFNLLVALFLLGVGFIGWIEGQDMHFDLVPGVEPENMAVTLIGLAVFALLAIALSLKRSKPARMLMFLWNLLVSSLLVCAFVRPSYKFDGIEHQLPTDRLLQELVGSATPTHTLRHDAQIPGLSVWQVL